jgi:HTH-type transcriptional regulator/antitoxin HigA
MEINPVRNDADLDDALREIERLWGSEPGTDDGDKLEILVHLVGRYEEKHYPASSAAPLDVLKFMMEQNGRTQSDLAALLGSRSRASEIMTGKRDLTLDQIRKLHREWRIPVAALIGERVAA